MGVVVTDEPYGMLPTTIGPVTRLLPSVAVTLIESPEDPVIDDEKLPSPATETLPTLAPVLRFVTVTLSVP